MNTFGSILLVPFLFHAGASPAPGAELQLGVGVADITPPAGYRMCGYFSERLSTGTRDPLRVKAMVLAQGEVKAALVCCDLIGMAREVVDRAREAASRKTGIPAAHIAVAATHSHTGPLYFDVLREHFHGIAVAKHGRDPQEAVDYSRLLEERLVAVIEKAHAGLRPVRLDAGIVPQSPQLSFNRRFHMKDGAVVFNPGQRNPNIVRAAGPIDPDVSVLLCGEAATGKPVASLTVFAMHLDTLGGTQYSGDYPYHLEEELRKALGPDFVSLFGTGTCGDLNHIDVTVDGRRPTAEIGALLGATVCGALPGLRRIEAPSLAVRRVVLDLPLQPFTEIELAQARKDLFKVGTSELTFLEQVRACTVVDLASLGDKSFPVEVQAFRLSPDVAIVTLPGEVFVELGLAIKRGSPFRTTLVIELANSDPAYIPTEKAFREGSYETVNSRLAPGSGERMVEAALGLLKEIAKQEE